MFRRDQFLSSLRAETETCKHLHGKIPAGGLEYRPGKGMRNTIELLRYLVLCGEVPARCFIHDEWSRAQEFVGTTADMASEAFPARMDEQLKRVEALMAEVSDEDLAKRKVKAPWGAEFMLGQALIESTLKFMTAYRMQLFLYAKAAGATQLDTANCWMGKDRPKETSA